MVNYTQCKFPRLPGFEDAATTDPRGESCGTAPSSSISGRAAHAASSPVEVLIKYRFVQAPQRYQTLSSAHTEQQKELGVLRATRWPLPAALRGAQRARANAISTEPAVGMYKNQKGVGKEKKRKPFFFFFLFPLRDHRSARADKPLAICDEQARGRLAAAPASTLGSAARHKIKPNQRPQRGPASKGIPLTEGSSYMKKNKNQIIPIKA